MEDKNSKFDEFAKSNLCMSETKTRAGIFVCIDIKNHHKTKHYFVNQKQLDIVRFVINRNKDLVLSKHYTTNTTIKGTKPSGYFIDEVLNYDHEERDNG